ncbi:sensor domain-containing protein [Massilibacterium senegalense]|uniref:sensor domain-containing protein n=1 Tax=Massilibacterium senegalense TaxID=1632858 RepID=UPI0007840D5A|nr:EAL domain-containing protein [Massilibacterium senegalense]
MIDSLEKYQLNKDRQEIMQKSLEIKQALDESTIVVITNSQGVITYVNKKFEKISKYNKSELIGQTHRILNSGVHSSQFFKEMWSTILQGQTWQGEICNKAKDGSLYWVNTTIIPFLDHHQKPYQFIAIRNDITKQKEAEYQLKLSLENDFLQTFRQLQHLIFIIKKDEQGEFIFTLFEGNLAQKYALSTNLAKNQTLEKVFPERACKKIRKELTKAFQQEASLFEVRLDDKQYFYCSLSPNIKNGEVIEVVGSAVDITERKAAEKQIHHLVYKDDITGLPNQRSFSKDIEKRIIKSIERNQQFGVFIININRFRYFNETYGYITSNFLLKSIGNRLEKYAKSGTKIYRFNDAVFIVLTKRTNEINTILETANQILSVFEEPFLMDHQDNLVSANIGISTFPKDGKSEIELLRNADIAVHIAKMQTHSSIAQYNVHFSAQLKERVQLEKNIYKALKSKQFMMYYQPKVDVQTNTITSCEALIRWPQKDGSFISPVSFIPIAEETGLIIPLSEWIIEEVASQYAAFQQEGIETMQISINLSAKHFQKRTITKDIENILKKYNMPPKSLQVEITEHMLMENEQEATKRLYELKEMGILIAIDDFGTGYSSLNYLRTLPVDILKIDQSFVNELPSNPKNKNIIRAIIQLSQALNLSVIAEGVETEEQKNFLLNEGCHIMQGYHFHRPIPGESMKQLMKNSLL